MDAFINPWMEMESYHNRFCYRVSQSSLGHDTIWVVIDRLTKSAHFLPIRVGYSMEKLAQIYLLEILRIHWVLETIISIGILEFYHDLGKFIQGIGDQVASEYNDTPSSRWTLFRYLKICWEKYIPFVTPRLLKSWLNIRILD